MKDLLFGFSSPWVGLVLRVSLGLIMLPHGAQKMLGWFGGYGFQATMNFFTQTMKLSTLIAFLVIVIEFVGAIALILGFAGRLWAFALIIVMIGAMATTTFKNGFFMNWFGSQPGEGYEYNLLVIAMCIALLISGSGRYSVDEALIN